jgi:CubicO group peptidase (beta-lactamase class C family)
MPARLSQTASSQWPDLVLLLALATAVCTARAASSESRGLVRLEEPLVPIREKHHLPALAAAVVRDGKLFAAGAVGVRRQGGDTPVTLEDRFHIGSCTKSMTATLAAMLVEEGTLTWTETVLDRFPEFAEVAAPEWKEATLERLLANRAGAPRAIEPALWRECWEFRGPPEAHRLLLLGGTLRTSPEAPPGTRYLYSNSGFAMAGAMIERAARRPWEILLRQRLFTPLRMHSAGFGPPATPGEEDQPWGHVWEAGEARPVPPGPRADNPPAIGPAGTVHCSILDLARYAAFHLSGRAEDRELVSRALLRKLHTPPAGQDYALGWSVAQRSWAGGTALNHTGSNTMFFCVIWIAPGKDFAVVVATNLGGSTAESAVDDAAAALVRSFVPPTEEPETKPSSSAAERQGSTLAR